MNKKITGSFFLLVSALIYGTFGVLSRYISAFGAFSQNWIKSFFIILLSALIFVLQRRSWKKIRREDFKWFTLWILPASFQPVLTFLAFNHLPIGMTYFLIYSTMILGGIASGQIFFSEKLNLNKVFSIIFLFIGIFLIYRTDLSLTGNIYVFMALISGLILGFWNTLTKKISGNYSEYQMLIIDGLPGLVLCLILSLVLSEKFIPLSDIQPWIWIFIYSAFSVGAGALLINGFKKVEAQAGSLILPMEIVFGSIFGFLIFREILKPNVYFGGFLILLAAVLSTFSAKEPTEGI